jgi:Protein of unknown function (DUF1615)
MIPRFGLACLLALSAVLSTKAQSADTLGQAQTAKLVSGAEKSVSDPRGWAIDLLDVLHVHDLLASKENICAVIAIVDQESNFVADPPVRGLGAISEKAIRDKLGAIPIAGRIALNFLETTPSKTNSYMQRIRNAKTERDLDMTYRALVDDAGRRSSLDVFANSGLLNTLIESRNDIDTVGSMQVSVNFALDIAKRRRWLPMTLADNYAVRDELYTRRGGMYYGVLLLLGYETGYNRKLYRFADFNAGRYASRNAALQKQTAFLSGAKLALDGDLLLYTKTGTPRSDPGASETAIRKIAKTLSADLTNKQIHQDLLLEKQPSFITTRTYLAIRDAYGRKANSLAAFAEVPQIALSSPKIKHAMTTANFAASVDRRYQTCMARKID